MAKVTAFERKLRAAFERTAGADNVTTALGIIRRKIHPRTVEAAARLEQQCHNPPPPLHYMSMVALDSLLGTCGVECLGDVDMRGGPPVEYLNTGDSYAATLVWHRDRSREWSIDCWADVAERLERQS